jgi:ubiquitin-like 1-activating enzyme E1 B
LNDLVENFLRVELGYGEEFVVNSDQGLLYDVDETENLDKKLSELSIKGDSFLTIIDEEEENPRVNLILNIQESATSLEGPSIVSLDGKSLGEIPRRQKPAAPTQNGISLAPANGAANGHAVESSLKNKRTAADAFDDDEPGAKRSKRASPGVSNDQVIVLDDADGSILIDDD